MEVKAIWFKWTRKLAALFGAALCLSNFVQPARAATILDQPDAASKAGNEIVLADMATKLSRRFQAGVGAPIIIASAPKALDLVSGSSSSYLMLAQRDVVTARLQAGASANIEVYGRIPACVLVLGRPGWSLGTDSARSSDVGAEQGWTAETIKILTAIEPVLASTRLEHRGGARALDRVRNGEDDIAFSIVYDDTLDPVTRTYLKDGLLAPIPLFGPSHLREAAKSGLQYQAGQITVPVAQSWWRQTRFETICTTLGVAVNTATDARLVETALASLISSPIDEATAKLDKIWETVRQEYASDIEKLRSVVTDIMNGQELKTIRTNLGVGVPEQKPGLVRPDTSPESSPTQQNQGQSLQR